MKSNAGFTLIELVIVITIIVLISGMGLMSLRGYTEERAVTDSARNFTSAVQLARSRAQTQVKPTTGVCASAPLDGYKVALTCGATGCTGYTVAPVCGGATSTTVKQDVFLSNVTVSAPATSFLFQTLTGTVQGINSSSTITFSKTGMQAISVTIYQDGRITNSNEK